MRMVVVNDLEKTIYGGTRRAAKTENPYEWAVERLEVIVVVAAAVSKDSRIDGVRLKETGKSGIALE